MKKRIIEFIPVSDVLAEYAPQPAKKMTPQWYKNQKRYINGEKFIPKESNKTSYTIKACIPVFDAVTAGYILVTQADVSVWNEESTIDGKPDKFFRWGAGQAIDFHDSIQFDQHPEWSKFHTLPKFISNYIIKTPKGYSCIIKNPSLHNTPFRIIEGIVDTDTYMNPINFPFYFLDDDFEGMIPAGTPIAQIIPFKRESWELKHSLPEKYEKEINYTKLSLLSGFFDRYRKKFWSPKEFN